MTMTPLEQMRANRELHRFIVVGVANTILSYGIYLLVLTVSTRTVAFTLAFLGGLCFTSLANVRIAFARKLTTASVGVYGVYYLTYWLASLAALEMVIRGLGVPEALGPMIVLSLSVPPHYLLSRLVLRPFERFT